LVALFAIREIFSQFKGGGDGPSGPMVNTPLSPRPPVIYAHVSTLDTLKHVCHGCALCSNGSSPHVTGNLCDRLTAEAEVSKQLRNE